MDFIEQVCSFVPVSETLDKMRIKDGGSSLFYYCVTVVQTKRFLLFADVKMLWRIVVQMLENTGYFLPFICCAPRPSWRHQNQYTGATIFAGPL